MIALGLPLALSFKDRVNSEVRSQAHSQAAIVATGAGSLIDNPGDPALDRLVNIAGRTVRGRVLVVDASGVVISDSGGSANVGSDYGSRPEIAAALAGRSNQIERDSQTLDTRLLATSDPIIRGNRTVGAVRITQSVEDVQSAVRRSLLGIGLLALLVIAFALLVGAVIASQIARPIKRLETTARDFATGGRDPGAEPPAEIKGSSEQRSLARSFNEMTARVSRLLRSQKDFVASASHQLRTPLTGLRLRLEGLSDGLDDPESRAEAEAGLVEVDRLSKMVDELLVLSRAGERDAPGEQIDLEEFAGEVCDRWAAAAGSRSVELRIPGPGPPGSAFCARADLERVLDVLMENAVNYSPPGSRIVVEVAPGRISVTDEGPGLEAGEEEAVFERFARGSAGRRGVKGTGLGLAIARELISQWGGTVTIASADPAGAKAVVAMPAGQPERA
jgi:signal transduction histidine kinase